MKNILFGLIGMLFFSCTSIAQTTQERKPASVVFTAAADFISAEAGCYTLMVRVYLTVDGETTLVSWSIVQSGTCRQRTEINANQACKDQEYKGDYFYYSKDDLKYCLVDLLKDEVLYSKYVIEKNRVIDSVKK